MPVSVYMMSGKIISLDIFEGFRVRNLRNEVYLYLRENDNKIDRDCLIFSKIENEDENEIEDVDDYDFVKDGDVFRVFVNPIEDIPLKRVRLSVVGNEVICLRNYEGFLIRYYGWGIEDRIDEFLDDEKIVEMPNRKIILEVDINEDGYEVMRNDIRKYVEYHREYESILDDLDSNERTFDIFFDRFMKVSFNNVEIEDIIYLNE